MCVNLRCVLEESYLQSKVQACKWNVGQTNVKEEKKMENL